MIRAFEDGLRDPRMRDLALGWGNNPSLENCIQCISAKENRRHFHSDNTVSRQPHTSFKQEGNPPKIQVTCYRCGLSDHYAPNCPSSTTDQNGKILSANIKLLQTIRIKANCQEREANCQERAQNNPRNFGVPDKPFNLPIKSNYRNTNINHRDPRKYSTHSQPPN